MNLIQNEPIIKIVNVSKSFQSNKNEILALDDINIEIQEKDIYGIIGLSGAGKSTLVRCINHLEVPSKGEVYYLGLPISRMTKKEIREMRRDMGMIFQSYNLLEQKTVLKNITFPLELIHMPKNERVLRARELLKMVGLSEKESRYPSELSGGERQRVAIARALATSPRVLLCDEATSALDPATTESILSLLKEIHDSLGITIVMITHSMHVIESICNRVAILENAKLQESGTVEEVFKNPKSAIGKKLIYPEMMEDGIHQPYIRIFFHGNVVEPVIAKMVLETGYLVSILSSNLKKTNEGLFGQMIIELPEKKEEQDKIFDFLIKNKLSFEEVKQ